MNVPLNLIRSCVRRCAHLPSGAESQSRAARQRTDVGHEYPSTPALSTIHRRSARQVPHRTHQDLIERAAERCSIAFTCESCRFSPTTLLQLLPSLKALAARRGAAIIDARVETVVDGELSLIGTTKATTTCFEFSCPATRHASRPSPSNFGGPSHREFWRELEGGRSDAVGHRADQEGNRGTG